MGSGLEAVGLSGEVAGEELRALLVGEHPVTGLALGRSFGESSNIASRRSRSCDRSCDICSGPGRKSFR